MPNLSHKLRKTGTGSVVRSERHVTRRYLFWYNLMVCFLFEPPPQFTGARQTNRHRTSLESADLLLNDDDD